jgi:methyl-accepting chemotaxis protein
MKRTWRRRNYFIKKELQGRYIFSFFISVLIGSFFFSVIFGLLSANTLTIVYKNYNLQLGKTPYVLFRDIVNAYWIFVVSGGVFVVIASMFISHRFAGPLYRLEKSLEEMNRGNLDLEITLRRKDEGKELAGMLNNFNTMLSSELKELRALNDELASHLLEGPLNQGEGTVGGGAMDKAIRLNKKIKEKLDRFTIKNNV